MVRRTGHWRYRSELALRPAFYQFATQAVKVGYRKFEPRALGPLRAGSCH